MTPQSDDLTLRYAGPAIHDGRMDAYEAAGCIMGFADFLGVSAKTLFGQDARLRTDVHAFRRGSFAVDFAVNVGAIASIFGASSPKDLFELAKSALELWKFLRGRPPTAVAPVEQGKISIRNNYGEVNIFQAETLSLVANADAAAAATRFVRTPLTRGIESMTLEYDGEAIATATEEDAPYIGVVVPLETLTDNTIRVWVMLESPVFRRDNKWRFSDGQDRFHAAIVDEDFLARVERHEVMFGKDDSLLVDLRLRQSGGPDGFKTEREIVKVHEHRHAPTQMRIG